MNIGGGGTGEVGVIIRRHSESGKMARVVYSIIQ